MADKKTGGLQSDVAIFLRPWDLCDNAGMTGCEGGPNLPIFP